MEQVDVVVIGAGVVGLAIARELAATGREVVLLEASDSIGTGISSRNSEVIHAGINYPPGSLKARLCVEGKGLLYAYCDEWQVAYRACGKLVVATSPEQAGALAAVAAQAEANGVHDLRRLTPEDVATLEPELQCVAALHSPSTGIVDSQGLMLALLADAEQSGAMLAVMSPVLGAKVNGLGIDLEVGGVDAMRLRARAVVNCAGLDAQRLAASFQGFPPQHVPPSHRCKGSYFALSGRAPFSRLVYPVPEAAGLGVHVTLDLGGQVRFGPDVEWLPDDEAHYHVDVQRADAFYEAIRRYWPALPDGALQPSHAGVRPKIQAPGEAARDFLVSGPADHGVPGLVHLFGIESPGLTASLALARHVAAML